jgi:hypothetical protein
MSYRFMFDYQFSRGGVLPLYHVLVIGQSNANGGGDLLLSTDTPGYTPQPLMFNGGVRPGGTGENLASLVPLVESSGGAQSGSETICRGMARQLNVLYPGAQFLFSVSAQGGANYTVMKKGTAIYADAIAQVTAAKNLAAAAGRQYKVVAICNLHGEQDQAANNTSYAANLLEWQTDYETDIKAITGQSGTIPMFVDQQSYSACDGAVAPTPQYVYNAWKSQPEKLILFGARYLYGCQNGSSSNLHISSYGQRWHGSLWAEAINAKCLLAQSWKPLSPIAGQVTLSGSTITVNLNVPNPPVQLAYDWVGRVGANHGFTYFDDTSPPSVTGVTVSGPAQLTVTLSGTPTGTVGSRKLRYAWGNGTSPGTAGPNYGTIRGNVCDTSVRNSLIDGLPLRNWMCIFEEAVT